MYFILRLDKNFTEIFLRVLFLMYLFWFKMLQINPFIISKLHCRLTVKKRIHVYALKLSIVRQEWVYTCRCMQTKHCGVYWLLHTNTEYPSKFSVFHCFLHHGDYDTYYTTVYFVLFSWKWLLSAFVCQLFKLPVKDGISQFAPHIKHYFVMSK